MLTRRNLLAASGAVLAAPSYVHLAYRPGVPLIGQVWTDGALAHSAL